MTAVVPYFGYARQDRKSSPRTPISAKLVANLIEASGANRVLTLDLHAGQIQGFFDIPVDNLYAAPVMVDDIRLNYNNEPLMFVSPDVGGVLRARAMAKRFEADLSIVDKRRERAGQSEVMNIIGDVEGRRCIIVDDIVDSAGTLCNAAAALKEAGAKAVHGYVSHAVLSGEAVARGLVIGARVAGRDGHHSDNRSRGERGQHPRAPNRAVDGRIDSPYQLGDLGLEPLRLTRATEFWRHLNHE